MCPYIQNEPMTIWEEQAWDVLTQCQSQPLVAGMGGVLGLNLSLALDLIQAKGYEPSEILEFITLANKIYLETREETDPSQNEQPQK